MKTLTLTIVIPVYNEESYLKTCLEAIAVQTTAPNEVIVVDNNCTDGSMDIARQFPFVKIIQETKQGWIPPRNKGFNAAKGEILARIDTDAVLRPDWVERALANFSDDSVAAITGPALARTINTKWSPYTRIWSLVYFWGTEAEFGIPILWGANMAIRKSAWQTIKNDASCDDELVHEDQDLSYVLAGHNLKVVRDNNLLMTTSGESIHNWVKLKAYLRRRYATRAHHEQQKTLKGSSQIFPLHARVGRLILVVLPGLFFIASSLVGAGYDRLTGKHVS